MSDAFVVIANTALMNSEMKLPEIGRDLFKII